MKNEGNDDSAPSCLHCKKPCIVAYGKYGDGYLHYRCFDVYVREEHRQWKERMAALAEAASIGMVTEQWICERCGISGEIRYRPHAGVREVLYLIEDDHKRLSPNCKGIMNARTGS